MNNHAESLDRNSGAIDQQTTEVVDTTSQVNRMGQEAQEAQIATETLTNETRETAQQISTQGDAAQQAASETRRSGGALKNLGGKLFGLSMAANLLAVGFSMTGGEMNEGMQKALIGLNSVGMLAPIAPMLMNPAGLVVAALAAVAGGLWFVNHKMNGVRDKAQKLADAMTTSAGEISKVSEYFGTESLIQRQGEIKIGDITGLQSEDIKAGLDFIGSDIGKEIAEQFNMNLAKSGRAKAAKDFSNKLASMMIQGIIDSKQAKQIAAGLAQQMGIPELAASVIGNLESVVGPDGENLLKNPLVIAARIVSDEKRNVQALVGPAQEAIDQFMEPSTWDAAKRAIASPLASLVTQLGIDLPYVTDVAKNIMGFIDDDFERAIENAHTYGKAIGNTLTNAYDNLNAAIIQNEKAIKKAKKEDRPEMRKAALEQEKRLRTS